MGRLTSEMDMGQQESRIEFDSRTRMSHALRVVLPALFIGGIVSALIMVITGDTEVAIVLSVGSLLLLISYFFQQRGRVQEAAVALIIILLAVVAYLALGDLGIHDLSVLLLPVVIVAASLLFDTRWFIGITAIVMTLVAVIVVGEVWGIYETPLTDKTGIDDIVTVWIIIILTAIPVRIMSEDLRGALFVAERSRLRYLGIFDGAPVSIWILDISDVVDMLDRLRESSPEGLDVYFDNHPEAVFEALSKLKVMDVNSKTIDMFEAESKEEFLSEFQRTFTPESVVGMKKMLMVVANGDSQGQTEAERVTLKGRKLVALTSMVPVAPEQGWVDQVLVSITDITAQKHLEAELSAHEHKIRQAYSEVLEAVTQEKLVVRGKHEIDEMLGEPIGGSMPVLEFSDLESSRGFVRRIIKDSFPELDDQGAVVMAIGEAVTNGVKHGGSCMLQVYKGETDGSSKMQVSVKDYGPGIDFLNMPRAVLVAGFSTKASLGMGFTIMLDLCDQLLMATDESGTTVVLEFNQRS